MKKRILDFDPFTREVTYHYYDENTDTTYIETVQDLQPYFKKNDQLRSNDAYQAHGRKTGMMHLATIPNSAIIKLKEEYGIDLMSNDQKDLQKMERLLQGSSLAKLKVIDGRF